MKRLTYKDSTLPRTTEHGELIEAYSDYNPRTIINRLAAYEDTGLEPEDINDFVDSYKTMRDNEEARVRLMCGTGAIHPERAAEITKAEAEGRLLVLPCKVGDTVYLRDLTPCKVLGISIGHYTRTVAIELNDGDRIPRWQPRGFDEFGVSVFTTREAAETALKERENNG